MSLLVSLLFATYQIILPISFLSTQILHLSSLLPHGIFMYPFFFSISPDDISSLGNRLQLQCAVLSFFYFFNVSSSLDLSSCFFGHLVP